MARRLETRSRRRHRQARLTTALFDANDYQSAIPLLEEQLAQEPKSPDLNYLLGASLWRSEQPEKALPYLELSVQNHSTNLPADAALGLTSSH